MSRHVALAFTATSVLLSFGLIASSAPVHAMPTDQDLPRQGMRALEWCASDSDWDCIESVEYLLDGEWTTAVVDNFPSWGGAVLNSPGLLHEEGRTQIRAEAFERYGVDSDIHPAYQLQLQSWPFGRTLWDPPIYLCDDSVQGNPQPGTDPCRKAPWLADTEYRMTFRSSKLDPILAMTSIKGMQTSYTTLPGGVRFSLAGRPGPSQWGLGWGDAESQDRFDAVTYEWAGLVTDARGANGMGAGGDCSSLGIATVYSNGGGSQMPRWDARTGSLTYGVSGRHYSPDGTVYRGFAEVFIPGQLARCLWGVDPRRTARMEVEVFEDQGAEVAGTKTISYDAEADVVKMIAIDFTYSQKSVVARSTPVLVAPGTRVCDATKTMCVSVDRSRKSATVTLSKVKGASEVVAVALRGAVEDGRTEARSIVTKGKASFTIKLARAKSKGQVWNLRTPSTFISSFEIG